MTVPSPHTLSYPVCCKANGQRLVLKCYQLQKTSTMHVSMHGDHQSLLNKLGCGSNSFYLLDRVK